MQVIDLHAHVTPERFKAAVREKGEWYGLGSRVGELQFPGFRMPPEERVAEMQRLGVDVQILSPNVGFFQYDRDLETTRSIARECNDEIAEMMARYPGRFGGLATLPMQDVPAAVAEMERVMRDLKFQGVEVGDHINGVTWDDPGFRPFFEAAESLGAIVFFHQSGPTVVTPRVGRYHLSNAIGNLTDRTITYACLVYGGVIDRFPRLKPLLAHAGGYTAFGAARMDKAAGLMEEGLGRLAAPEDPVPGYISPLDSSPEGAHRMEKAPSSYLGAFYYDCCTFTGPTLRFLVDTVGLDRVVLGTDYPAPMELLDPVNWVNGLDCLNAGEKEAILASNAAALLGS
ncbi:MAG: amidohydrolase family protein [Candidatus Dormibacterales bacterium]